MAPNKLADLLLVHVYLCPPSVNLVSKALSRITRAWTPFRRAEDMFGKRPHPGSICIQLPFRERQDVF